MRLTLDEVMTVFSCPEVVTLQVNNYPSHIATSLQSLPDGMQGVTIKKL